MRTSSLWRVATDGGREVALSAARAETFLARLAGWMFRRSLRPDEALHLPDCPAIHTCFMRFSIDVVFLDGGDRVLAVRESVAPWRAASFPGARSVLELPARAASRAGLSPGTRLVFLPLAEGVA